MRHSRPCTLIPYLCTCTQIRYEVRGRLGLILPMIGMYRALRLLGDNEGAMQEQQIAALADDRSAWENLVVACSAADG